jgi:hypothetical protein
VVSIDSVLSIDSVPYVDSLVSIDPVPSIDSVASIVSVLYIDSAPSIDVNIRLEYRDKNTNGKCKMKGTRVKNMRSFLQ